MKLECNVNSQFTLRFRSSHTARVLALSHATGVELRWWAWVPLRWVVINYHHAGAAQTWELYAPLSPGDFWDISILWNGWWGQDTSVAAEGMLWNMYRLLPLCVARDPFQNISCFWQSHKEDMTSHPLRIGFRCLHVVASGWCRGHFFFFMCKVKSCEVEIREIKMCCIK